MDVILHCDANSFYASCEVMQRPELQGLPVSVGGDQEARHGIVLASTVEAKKYGVKTGMALWQARELCPRLIILKPDFRLYMEMSRRLRQMYQEYSPRVESYGLDECWLDLSEPGMTMTEGKHVADTLRERAKDELGLCLSVGVSFNKIFSKLGSDYQKPDATTVITQDNYKSIVWPLPVSDLMFVGPRTTLKLRQKMINTIGDLAATDANLLRGWFGKVGVMHYENANGLDRSPVMETGFESAIKSIGNSTTTPIDMLTCEDVKCVITLLSESVSTRLREAGLQGRCISLYLRDTDLKTVGCQITVNHDTALCDDICKTAMDLFTHRGCEAMLPLRSAGVSVSTLRSTMTAVQLDLFGMTIHRDKLEHAERAVDDIRRRYGMQSVLRGNVMAQRAFSKINPYNDHVIHPVPWYAG